MYGPVIDCVYAYFCGKGAEPIKSNFEINIDINSIKIIDKVIKEKIEKKPWELVNETHKEGGAWECVYDNGEGTYKIIPIELIRKKG